MIRKQRLIKLTQDLIRINSQNPPGNEKKIADFLAGYLKSRGLRAKAREFKKNRANVLAYLAGKTGKTLLISPHLDTVPAGSGWKHGAFSARIKNGKIYGRGASDCKCNIAMAAEALVSLKEENITPLCNIIFAATADEETGSKEGIIALIKNKALNADYAVILDSDEFNIVTAQKGLMHFRVEVFGKSAHGAYPERGVNAIEAASRIICALKNHKFPYTPHPLLKGPTLNIGTIRGGDKVNIVADFCQFEVDLRYLPGMDKKKIIADLKRIIAGYARKFKIEFNDIQEPYSLGSRHPLADKFLRAAQAAGIKAKIKGSEGATVITFFKKHNIPAISFGCGSEGCAHIKDEYVKTANLYKGAKIMETFLKTYEG